MKKETLIITVLVTFAAGFFCGVIYSAFKTVPGQGGSQQQAQAPTQDGGPTLEQSQALLALEQEVKRNPDNNVAWTQLGNLFFDTKQHENAIKAYTKALEIAPGDPAVLTDLGVMYRRSGQPENAIKSFAQAMSADPSHEQSRMNTAIVLGYDLDDWQGAVKALQELQAVNPLAAAPNGAPIAEMIGAFQEEATKAKP